MREFLAAVAEYPWSALMVMAFVTMVLIIAATWLQNIMVVVFVKRYEAQAKLIEEQGKAAFVTGVAGIGMDVDEDYDGLDDDGEPEGVGETDRT